MVGREAFTDRGILTRSYAQCAMTWCYALCALTLLLLLCTTCEFKSRCSFGGRSSGCRRGILVLCTVFCTLHSIVAFEATFDVMKFHRFLPISVKMTACVKINSVPQDFSKTEAARPMMRVCGSDKSARYKKNVLIHFDPATHALSKTSMYALPSQLASGKPVQVLPWQVA